LVKYEDARSLLNRIREALDAEILDRNQNARGWSHYGDACRLLEELKELGHLFHIDRNEVADNHACPHCGTKDADHLIIQDDARSVRCTVCGCRYELD